MKIIWDAICLEKTTAPLRLHELKRWMWGRCYHQRVQKKWLKRWGVQYRPAIFKIGADTLIAHPAFETVIAEALSTPVSGQP